VEQVIRFPLSLAVALGKGRLRKGFILTRKWLGE
jgi:hypothetical protein